MSRLEEKLDSVAGLVASLGQMFHQSLDRETKTADILLDVLDESQRSFNRKWNCEAPDFFPASLRCEVLQSSWEPLDG